MNYVAPTSLDIVADFTSEEPYVPPMSGELVFEFPGPVFVYTWQKHNRVYKCEIYWTDIEGANKYEIITKQESIIVDRKTVISGLKHTVNVNYDLVYEISITAKANDGTVIQTDKRVEKVPEAIPEKPFNVVGSVTETSVSLVWDTDFYSSNSKISLYKKGELIKETDNSLNSCVFGELVNGTDYLAIIHASNDAGYSEAYEYPFKTLYVLPEPVTNIRQEKQHTMIVPVKWDLPSNTQVTEIEIEARDTSGVVFYNETSKKLKEEANVYVLLETEAIEVRIRAGNPKGWSAWSAWVSLVSEGFLKPDSLLGMLAATEQPLVQHPETWTGTSMENRGIIEKLGISPSLMISKFRDVNKKTLYYEMDKTLQYSVKNMDIVIRNAVKHMEGSYTMPVSSPSSNSTEPNKFQYGLDSLYVDVIDKTAQVVNQTSSSNKTLGDLGYSMDSFSVFIYASTLKKEAASAPVNRQIIYGTTNFTVGVTLV